MYFSLYYHHFQVASLKINLSKKLLQINCLLKGKKRQVKNNMFTKAFDCVLNAEFYSAV